MIDPITPEEITAANDIGDKTGMGEPDLSESTPAAEEAPVEPKPVEAPAPVVPKPDETPADPEEGEDGAEGDEPHSRMDPKPVEKKEKMVPYEKLKHERGRVDALATQVSDVVAAVSELTQLVKKGNTPEVREEADDIRKEAEALAEELGVNGEGLDPDALEKVLRKAVELAGKNGKVPKGMEEKMALLETLEQNQKKDAETAHFNGEWQAALPTIKTLYPNATQSMLDEARAELDKLSHSKDFHTYSLEDIVASPRNKKTFDTLLKVAGKAKNGEVGKRVGESPEERPVEDDDNIEDIENLTPAIIKAREASSSASRASSNKDYKVTAPMKVK